MEGLEHPTEGSPLVEKARRGPEVEAQLLLLRQCPLKARAGEQVWPARNNSKHRAASVSTSDPIRTPTFSLDHSPHGKVKTLDF